MTDRRLNKLIEAVRNLEFFLFARHEDFWAGKLKGVRHGLKEDDRYQEARIKLDSFFGGMGSLNDLVFGNDLDDAEFGRLADAVFKENRLVDAKFGQSLKWRFYEFANRNDLPPRVKNAFAK